MQRHRQVAFAVLMTLAAGRADPAWAPSEGYAPRGALDATRVVAPAPQPGDPRWEADRAIFRATRWLDGSPRWAVAVHDVQTDAASLMADFSCAIGLQLTPATAPRTLALLTRATIDTAAATDRAKLFYRHPRPFTIDQGPTCQSTAEAARTYDYPSGHSTLGWTWALLLAKLAPDRAASLLARGRAYGESRMVCGVHTASAVDAARVSAAYALSAIAAEPEFRRDLSGARSEIARLRRTPDAIRPDAAVCAAENRTIAAPLFRATPAGQPSLGE